MMTRQRKEIRKVYMQEFEALPTSVKDQVKETLRAYSRANIVFMNGEYHVTTGICLMSLYPSDHRFIGTVYEEYVYTPDERIINYIETFCDYPIQYKGTRDYDMLRYMQSCKANGEKVRICLVDGTAHLVEPRKEDKISLTVQEAYAVISKHIFIASHRYSDDFNPVIILADNLEAAKWKAAEHFGVTVNVWEPTKTETADILKV
jgi:hypothetical protein